MLLLLGVRSLHAYESCKSRLPLPYPLQSSSDCDCSHAAATLFATEEECSEFAHKIGTDRRTYIRCLTLAEDVNTLRLHNTEGLVAMTLEGQTVSA